MSSNMVIFSDIGGSDNSPGTSASLSGYGPPNLRLKTADDLEINTSNPIPIPSDGTLTNNSFWKHVYLYCSSAPDTQVDNVKFYTDGGGFGTGITTWVGDETPTKNSGSDEGYAVAVGTVGDTGRGMTSQKMFQYLKQEVLLTLLVKHQTILYYNRMWLVMLLVEM